MSCELALDLGIDLTDFKFDFDLIADVVKIVFSNSGSFKKFLYFATTSYGFLQ